VDTVKEPKKRNPISVVLGLLIIVVVAGTCWLFSDSGKAYMKSVMKAQAKEYVVAKKDVVKEKVVNSKTVQYVEAKKELVKEKMHARIEKNNEKDDVATESKSQTEAVVISSKENTVASDQKEDPAVADSGEPEKKLTYRERLAKVADKMKHKEE